MQRQVMFTIALLSLATLTTLTHAKSDPAKKAAMKTSVVDVALFDSLPLDEGARARSGQHRTFKLPGQRFIALTVRYDPVWTKEHDWVKPSYNSITLKTTEGKACRMVGVIEDGSTFDFGKPYNPSYSRPYLWEKNSSTKFFVPVFAIPADAKRLKFSAEGKTWTITAGESQPFYQDADQWKVTVKSARIVDGVASEFGNFRDKHPVLITYPGWQLIEVKLTLQPTKRGFDGELFHRNAGWLTASANGQPGLLIGERLRNSPTLLTNTTSHVVYQANKGWPTQDVTYYFAIPKNAKTYNLHWRGKPKTTGLTVPVRTQQAPIIAAPPYDKDWPYRDTKWEQLYTAEDVK